MFPKISKLTAMFRMGIIASAYAFCSQANAGVITLTPPDEGISTEPGSVLIEANETIPILDTIEPGQVIYENVDFVDGNARTVIALNSLQLGEYQLTLSDFVFPNTFATLGAVVTTESHVVARLFLDDDNTQDTMTFEITEVDSYYLSILGVATGGFNLGLYGVELKNVGISAVPLPLPAFMFLSGIVLLGAFKRKPKGC